MASTLNPEQMRRKAADASGLLKALSNESRLAILCLLCDGERPVGELVRDIGLSQSALSQHLARLRVQGLVTTRRQGQTIYYTLASSEARLLIDALYRIYCV